jgi:hypothetical protein
VKNKTSPEVLLYEVPEACPVQSVVRNVLFKQNRRETEPQTKHLFRQYINDLGKLQNCAQKTGIAFTVLTTLTEAFEVK